MKAELKTITPEWAAEILRTKNTLNRALNKSHVLRLAAEITNGRWKVNGDTICLNGTLLVDGQHRLAAVVQSGIPIQTFVVEGVPFDVFPTKDNGKLRSKGDTLQLSGEKNAARLAGALAWVERYMTGQADNEGVRFSNTEIGQILQKYPGVRNSVDRMSTGRKLIPPTLLSACHYLFSMWDQNLADEFVEKVTTGTGLEPHSPWLLLRGRLINNSIAKAKLPRVYIFALCIKAWNAARAGLRLQTLRWRESGDKPEAFPSIK